MKHIKLIPCLGVLIWLLTYTNVYSDYTKDIQIGKYQTWVNASTAAGEMVTGDRGLMYYTGFAGWPACAVQNAGWYLGTKNWADTSGTVWPIKLTGAAPVTSNEQQVTMPVPDENGIFIKRYMRYKPPYVEVDGYQTSDLWGYDGDIVDPTANNGTADARVTCGGRADLGMTMTQKVYSWGQTNHDDYIIFDWTFTNTGNVDLDDEIELPDQTLDSLYFLRASRLERWDSEFIYNGQGEYEEDSLRLRYAHPGRRTDGSATGNGYWAPQDGWLWNPESMGEAILFAPEAATDNVADQVNDPNQPFMTATENSDLLWIRNDPSTTGPGDWAKVYRVMSEGWDWRNNVPLLTPGDLPPEHAGKTLRPGKHHMEMDDEMVLKDQPYMKNLDWVTYAASYFWSAGPYTVQPGQSLRFVWADGFGVINPLKNWEIGSAFSDGEAITPPPGGQWDAGSQTGNMMPPTYDAFPQLYDNDQNTWAKDAWIFTGIDSLLQNMSHAQFNMDHNYNIPVPPPPPDVFVTSQSDHILIHWDGVQSESADDFAGYRIYRSEGFRYEGYDVIENPRTRDHGRWQLLAEFPGTGTHDYNDVGVERGEDYYYYVAAYDDGSDATPDVNGYSHSLESGRFLNSTGRAASLTDPQATGPSGVSTIPNKVMLYQNSPNPFNNTTEISFSVPVKTAVQLDIYNVLGQRAETLTKGVYSPGRYQIVWDAVKQSSGTYFVVLTTKNQRFVKRTTLLK